MAVTRAENVIKIGAQDDTVAGNIVIHKIRWVGATTAGHKVNIANTAGGDIFASHAPSTNWTEDVNFSPPLMVKGIDVDDLDSGTVYLYV